MDKELFSMMSNFLRMLVICIKTHITIVFKQKYPCENRALMESYSSGYPIFLKMLPIYIKTYIANVFRQRNLHEEQCTDGGLFFWKTFFKCHQIALKHIAMLFIQKISHEEQCTVKELIF